MDCLVSFCIYLLDACFASASLPRFGDRYLIPANFFSQILSWEGKSLSQEIIQLIMANALPYSRQFFDDEILVVRIFQIQQLPFRAVSVSPKKC